MLLKADKDLYRSLMEKKLLIRDCSNFAGLRHGYYRISVLGGEKKFIEFFKES